MSKSRLSKRILQRLVEYLVAGTTAQTAAAGGGNKTTTAYYYHRLRELNFRTAADNVLFAG